MNKLLCKKDYILDYLLSKGMNIKHKKYDPKFCKDNWYKYEIFREKIRIYYTKKLWYDFHNQDEIWNYFYTKKELRKIKLDKLK